MSSAIQNSFYRDRSSRLRQTLQSSLAYKNENNTSSATPPSSFHEYLESKTKTNVEFPYGCYSPIFNNRVHRYNIYFEKGSKKKMKKSVDKRNKSHKPSPLSNVVSMEDIEKDEKWQNDWKKWFAGQLEVEESQFETINLLSNKGNVELWEEFIILPDDERKQQNQHKKERLTDDNNEFYKFVLCQQTIFSNKLSLNHTRNYCEKSSISMDNRNCRINSHIFSSQYERDSAISEDTAAKRILKFYRRTPKFRNAFSKYSRTPAEAAKRFEVHCRSFMPRMIEDYKSVQIAKFTILQILRQVYADEEQYQKHIKFFNEYYGNTFGQGEEEAQVKVNENDGNNENNENQGERKVLDEREDDLLNACIAFQSNHYILRKVTSEALRKFLPYYLLYRHEGGKYAVKFIKEFN